MFLSLRPIAPRQLQSRLQSFSKTFVAAQVSTNSFHTSRPVFRILPEMANERPTGLKASKGIELLTWGTPNGVKASIILEELKEAYGLEYTWQGINISQNIQKEEWFTKLGANGRIPVIVDHDKGGFSVQEGSGK